MKKRISKLDDLVHAARSEAPVMSFEEAAQRIASLAEKRRKPLWMWLANAWAFPLRKLRTLQMPSIVWLPSRWTFIQGALLQGAFGQAAFGRAAFGRGFAGACAVALVLSVFPALIHDMRFANGYSPNAASMQASNGNNQSSEEQTNNNERKPRFFAQRNALSALPSPSSSSLKSTLALSAETNTQTQSASHETTSHETVLGEASKASAVTQQIPEYGITTALRQQEPQGNSINIVPLPSKTPSVLERKPESASALVAERTEGIPPEVLQTLAQELTFWQRVSLEARLSARADIRPQAATATDAQASASEAISTPLQNIALGMYYALSEHHSIGVEGGNEPFLTSVRITNGSLAAAADTNRGFNNTSLLPSGSTSASRGDQYRQSSTNRTWFGAAYQYNADVWDVFGGVQPLARITLGGGELGAVGRTLVGARLMAKERFSIVFAGEGAAVASQLQGVWNLTPRLGITLGLSVKF